MSHTCEVLIVGGGVIGLTTAWYLAGEGVRVTLVEKGEIGRQASWAGAGILPPADLDHARHPAERLRALSGRLYPQISADLRERTGIDNGFIVCGGIELLEPGTKHPSEEWHSEGAVWELLDHQGLHSREPDLAPELEAGIWLPGMAQVRNPRHLRALQAGCASRGVTLLPLWPVERLIRQGNRVTAVEGDRGRLSPGQVVLATGAWSETLLRQVGWQPGIIPVRGQMALLETGRSGVRPVVVEGKRYIVPRLDGRVLVGSTEECVGFDVRPTAGGIAGLLELARRLVPALAQAPLETCWAGLRPGSPDGLPFMGSVPGWDNLHVACGHFRSGLQLSPGTGFVMAQHLLGRPAQVPLDVFRLDRPLPAHAGMPENAFR